jgi:hypothetical protein
MKITYADERDLQRKIAKKLSDEKYSFRVGVSSYFCDVLDDFSNIYMEVKVGEDFAAAQLLYGAVREFGTESENDFKPQLFGLATPDEVRFFSIPNYASLVSFYNKIDASGKTAPSMVPKIFNQEALKLLGQPIHINQYDKPLDFTVPYIFISSSNIFYIISKLEKYDIDIRELISKLSDVYVGKGEISVIKKGGIQDNVDGSIVKSKPIKPVDEYFIKSLRITPHDLQHLSAHLDEYQEISKRRKLGKFYTSPKLSNKVENIIRKYVEPSLIIEPYCGSGSLLLPFIGTKMIANDISAEDVEVAKLSFEGEDILFDTIDCIDYSAAELIEKWGIKSSDNLLIYSNPPFGTSFANKSIDSVAKISGSRKTEIKYRPELLKYAKGDLLLPAVGQMIEMMQQLGKGYLAFYSPFNLFCAKKRHRKLLEQLLSQFTFLEGHMFSGSDFNGVSSVIPIIFSIWKFGGQTEHLDLKFSLGDKEVSFKEGFHLKEGWIYLEQPKIENELCVKSRLMFNDPTPAIFSDRSAKASATRVVKENVKINIHFDNFPSELIYSLWGILVGWVAIVKEPIQFHDSYVHMPKDFTIKENQLILVYTIINTLLTEQRSNYTKGKICFTDLKREIVFGTPEQSKAVRDLLKKYEDEPCLDSSVGDVIERMKKEEVDYKLLRKDLKQRLSKLLEDIGYWDYVIVKPVELEKIKSEKLI